MLKYPLKWLIAAYKIFVSPLFPPSCRFHPTCSDYAREALDVHGAARGMCLSAWRILRCHPFNRGGFDPVPGAVKDRVQPANNADRF